MKKKTNEEYVEELREELSKTGDLDNYDLSLVNYTTAKDKVTVVCSLHGEKLISPFHLLNGRRCNECKSDRLSKTNRADWGGVMSKAVATHENKYLYDKFTYINNGTKGIVTCPEHGDFEISMNHHIGRKQGCQKCKKSKPLFTIGDLEESFLEKTKIIHGDRYSYELLDYKTCKDVILVTCKKHGPFMVTPDNHINALSGCPKCSNKVSMGELEVREFIDSLLI